MNAVEVFIHVDVSYSEDVKSERRENARSFVVACQLRCGEVRFAIDLDNQFAVESDEIHDLAADWTLTAKLPVGELAVSKNSP